MRMDIQSLRMVDSIEKWRKKRIFLNNASLDKETFDQIDSPNISTVRSASPTFDDDDDHATRKRTKYPSDEANTSDEVNWKTNDIFPFFILCIIMSLNVFKGYEYEANHYSFKKIE